MDTRKRKAILLITFISVLLLTAAGFFVFRMRESSPADSPLSQRKPVGIPNAFPSLDIMPPFIILTGGREMTVNIGYCYIEPGFTATDNVAGDLTKNVIVSGGVDTSRIGTYIITYRVFDNMKNSCTVTRTVRVVDQVAPVITLAGEGTVYLKRGSPYKEPGYSAADNVDGDLTSRITVSGTVNTEKAGRNDLTYTVSDASGNTASAVRTVYVYKKQAVSNPADPGDKVVYLTFDDGPSKYTARLLDILDKYGVKVTFFITNQFPAYQNMIGEAHRRGHTIALHTFSHRYESVYHSEDSYYQDLQQIHDVAVSQTGVEPFVVRFPGGTNNLVSRKYTPGIMTKLVGSISYHGYLYCDWNVSSGDAGGARTKEQVAANVIAGIQKHSISYVLQHDIKEHSVEAVDEIIAWGLANGYTFLPLTETSPLVHFQPQN